MFIGAKEIKTVVPDVENEVIVEFEDGSKATMRNNCLDVCTSEEKRDGEVYDALRFSFARKYLMDMAEHGLDYMQVEQIAQGITTLGRNLRDQACGMAFGVGNPLEIKVEDVFAAFMKEEGEEEASPTLDNE